MSKWLNQFLENEIVNRSDKSDRFRLEANMSPLSLRPRGLLDENLEKVENNPRKGGDKSARFKFRANMSPNDEGLLSVFSVPLKEPFAETSFYPLDATSLLNEYQERLAIVEYDGLQTATQAERIAYLDAFMAVLATLPYEDFEGDWLAQRIKVTQAWLLDQGLQQAK